MSIYVHLKYKTQLTDKEILKKVLKELKVNFSENGLFENLDNKEKQMEDINNYLENKLTTYKHTFNKSDDGSFYWYSTEPIN